MVKLKYEQELTENSIKIRKIVKSLFANWLDYLTRTPSPLRIRKPENFWKIPQKGGDTVIILKKERDKKQDY